ncbi:MAG: OmpA family protein [Fibrobacter sp.]|nr:OmpA family protein [Fibrobacter sp.]
MSTPRSLKTTIPYLGAVLLLTASFSFSREIDATQIPLTMTFSGLRGLTQTLSGESQGTGRLTVNVSGSWYQQDRIIIKAPNAGTNVGTGTFAFSFAPSNHIELFANLSLFGLNGYDYSHGSGIGSISGGIQGMLPLPAEAPFRLGAQFVLIGGTSANQINNNFADGYNYFETRTGYDMMGRLIESLILGNEKNNFKFMLNQAFVTSVEEGQDLMLLSAGIQGIFARYFSLGVELNSRTYLSDVQILQDPLWITPSFTIRTPYFVSFGFGSDIALSEKRTIDPAIYALEKYRLFGSMTFSVDVLARKRREASEKAQSEAYEKAELQKKAKDLEERSSALAKKAYEDSLAQQHRADSLTLVAQKLAEKTRRDSIALADSLIEVKKKLEEEKSKRSEAEQQLLSTGMLILDAVYFESGKTEISINSRPYLKIIGKMLEKYPKLLIEVGGHTDNIGRYNQNILLSQLRGESVRSYLVSEAPSLIQRLTARGYGPDLPKASNSNAEGRKVNRRVELKVINTDALQEYNR